MSPATGSYRFEEERMSVAAAAEFYAFKLELPDGSWDVDEKRLPERPQVGGIVEFGSWWQVRGVERVRTPVRKPDRELFVCRLL
jgi:hypothetical protein